MKNPARDLVNHFNSAGIGLTKGTNLFASQRRAAIGNVPVNAVFVYGVLGAPPVRVMGQSTEVLTAIVSATIRWNTYSGADNMARNMRDAVQGQSIAGYLDVFAATSEPSVLGEDADGSHLMLMGFELTYNQASA